MTELGMILREKPMLLVMHLPQSENIMSMKLMKISRIETAICENDYPAL